MLLNLEIRVYSGEWKRVFDDTAKMLTFHEITGDIFVGDRPAESYHDYRYSREFLADHDMVCALTRLGVPLDIKSGAGDSMLVKLQEKIKALGGRVDSMAEAIEKGCVVQIAIPDLGLLQIDEVDHLDDCCTDNLQRHLKEGWRILAVCPPNAQRRPDYIIGRRKQP